MKTSLPFLYLIGLLCGFFQALHIESHAGSTSAEKALAGYREATRVSDLSLPHPPLWRVLCEMTLLDKRRIVRTLLGQGRTLEEAGIDERIVHKRGSLAVAQFVGLGGEAPAFGFDPLQPESAEGLSLTMRVSMTMGEGRLRPTIPSMGFRIEQNGDQDPVDLVMFTPHIRLGRDHYQNIFSTLLRYQTSLGTRQMAWFIKLGLRIFSGPARYIRSPWTLSVRHAQALLKNPEKWEPHGELLAVQFRPTEEASHEYGDPERPHRLRPNRFRNALALNMEPGTGLFRVYGLFGDREALIRDEIDPAAPEAEWRSLDTLVVLRERFISGPGVDLIRHRHEMHPEQTEDLEGNR